MGNLLAVVVHAANIHDTKAGISVAEAAFKRYPTIRGFNGDAGYKGSFELELWDRLKLGVDIIERIDSAKWKILPKRWIVERTFSCFNTYRALSKYYELIKSSAVTMVKISHFNTLLKRV